MRFLVTYLHQIKTVDKDVNPAQSR